MVGAYIRVNVHAKPCDFISDSVQARVELHA